jgi:hypothetical protein
MAPDDQRYLAIETDEGLWNFDRQFLTSRWRCIWGEGCQGIHDTAEPELADGCCSVGAELIDADESRLISALGATLDPDLFERCAEAADDGVFSDASLSHTRVIDGACIFFNRPGFAGGAGCALHLSAVADGDSPVDWKPTVCWQLPLKVDRSEGVPTVRGWRRADWGPGGETMAWCCSDPAEAPEAFTSPAPVYVSMADELRALAGDDAYSELARRLSSES